MKKRVICLVISVLLILSLAVSFVACNKDEEQVEDNSLTITYLGDSICEALIGPSPVSERDNYGYYALLGKCNGYNYYNHSVSGHKTSGSMIEGGGGLKELLLREDETATLIKTHVVEADIIHISILGNNALQYNLAMFLAEAINPDWYKSSDWYINEEWKQESEFKTWKKEDVDVSIFTALHDGEYVIRPSITYDENDNVVLGATTEKFDFPESYNDIGTIISTLKTLNPDAIIFIQKVYNPVYEGTTLITDAVYTYLGSLGATTTKAIREAADVILDYLNGILDEYLEANPGAFYILDTNAEYKRISALDKTEDGETNLATGCLGRELIYKDWTHPSNMGHAAIADITQQKLEELGLADHDSALANYKSIRLDQIDRLYAGVSGFDTAAVKSAINAATSYTEVSTAYFKATLGVTPIV